MVNKTDDEKMQKTQKDNHSGWDFYTNVLNSPKFIVAPMVDQSELAWRMLCRRYGAQLCYTPMFHSNLFVKDPKYRKESLQTCPEDRPLIVQFCGNDPKTILEAALLAQDYCDAIDINLGCPQAIAKRGHYGAFLQDEWELLSDIVRTLHENLKIPVTCKARIFSDKQKTIDYVKMLENSGCQLLTLHGRTREQKGPLTGLADWSYVRTVRDHIKIPIFSNGNILSIEDVYRCLDETKVQGVMSAEGNLYNPAIFKGIIPKTWDMANEYLDFVELYPCPISFIRGHLFKLFHQILNLKSNTELRESLATARVIHQFRAVVQSIKDKYEPYHEGKMVYSAEECALETENKTIDKYEPYHEGKMVYSAEECALETENKTIDKYEPYHEGKLIYSAEECALETENKTIDKYEPYHEGKLIYSAEECALETENKTIDIDYNLSLPPWLCQPYIRPPPEEHKKVIEEKIRIAEDPNTIKRQYFDNDGNEISRKRMKRLRRKYRRPQIQQTGEIQERILQFCAKCTNPMGIKCESKLCRICCRDQCYLKNLDCIGHKIFIKTRRERKEKNLDSKLQNNS